MTPNPLPDPDPREKKLPLYAQELLRSCRERVAQWEAYAVKARLDTNPDETDTIIDDYSDHPIGLPRGEAVKFRQPGDRHRRAYITARMQSASRSEEAGWVLIQAGDMIEVRPQSGNTILVRQVPRD